MRSSVLWVALVGNAVALACVLFPKSEAWLEAGVVFFVLEAVFFVLVGIPVFIHHFVRQGRGFRESVEATVDSVLGFLTGWV